MGIGVDDIANTQKEGVIRKHLGVGSSARSWQQTRWTSARDVASPALAASAGQRLEALGPPVMLVLSMGAHGQWEGIIP